MVVGGTVVVVVGGTVVVVVGGTVVVVVGGTVVVVVVGGTVVVVVGGTVVVVVVGGVCPGLPWSDTTAPAIPPMASSRTAMRSHHRRGRSSTGSPNEGRPVGPPVEAVGTGPRPAAAPTTGVSNGTALPGRPDTSLVASSAM